MHSVFRETFFLSRTTGQREGILDNALIYDPRVSPLVQTGTCTTRLCILRGKTTISLLRHILRQKLDQVSMESGLDQNWTCTTRPWG